MCVRWRMSDVLLGDVLVLSSRMPRVLPVHCAGLGVYILARCVVPTKTHLCVQTQGLLVYISLSCVIVGQLFSW